MNLPMHDIIKIQYIRQGYLPDVPYHMVSDEEMFDAFLSYDSDTQTYSGYFVDMYPNKFKDADNQVRYNSLINYIYECIVAYFSELKVSIPDWVYSYMLGVPISDRSNLQDKHNFLVLLGMSNPYDIFDDNTANACYEVSTKYLKRTNDNRVPTIFGEPHVIKELRLTEVSV